MTQSFSNEDRYRALLQCPSILNVLAGFDLFEREKNLPVYTSVKFPERLVFGKKMEVLFSHYIRSSKRYELLAENLQIRNEETTLGELDFLIRDKQELEILHVEMACKFYLNRPGLNNEKMACWIGPNGRDRLVDKMKKLRERQFPMLHHSAVGEQLQKLNVEPTAVKQKLFLPGILFLPKSQETDSKLNADPVQGYWLSTEDFIESDFSNSQLAIPAKENWLLDPSLNKNWLQPEEAKVEVRALLEKQRSPMVWLRTNQGDHHRFFVLWW